jgi:hypothetical protein
MLDDLLFSCGLISLHTFNELSDIDPPDYSGNSNVLTLNPPLSPFRPARSLAPTKNLGRHLSFSNTTGTASLSHTENYDFTFNSTFSIFFRIQFDGSAVIFLKGDSSKYPFKIFLDANFFLSFENYINEPSYVSLSNTANLALNSGDGRCTASAIDISNGFLYVSNYLNPPTVTKIRLSDFTRISNLSLSGSMSNCTSMNIDTVNGFLYCVDFQNPCIISKVRLSDFTEISTLTLNAGEGNSYYANIDVSNGFLYINCSSGGTKVVKIRLSDFTRNAVIDISPYTSTCYTGFIDTSLNKLFTIQNSTSAVFTQIDLTTFTYDKWFAYYLVSGYVPHCSFSSDNSIVYLVIRDTNGKVFTYNTTTETFTVPVDFGSDYSTSNFIISDVTRECLIVSTYTYPAKFYLISLYDFTVLHSITLPAGKEIPNTVAYDSTNRNAYFCEYLDTPDCLKINLVETPPAPVTAKSTQPLSLNKQHSVMCTNDGTNLNLFINGQLDNSILIDVYKALNNTNNIVMGPMDNANTFMNIDDLKFFNRALSIGEYRKNINLFTR